MFQNSHFCQATEMAIFHKPRGVFHVHSKRCNGRVATSSAVLNKCIASVNVFCPYLGEFAIYPVLAAVYRGGTAPISNGAARSEAAGLFSLQ